MLVHAYKQSQILMANIQPKRHLFKSLSLPKYKTFSCNKTICL